MQPAPRTPFSRTLRRLRSKISEAHVLGNFGDLNFFQLLRQLELCEAFALRGFSSKNYPGT
jgi:hypothetical protein